MRLSVGKVTFLPMQAAATWLLECPDVARQQLLWQKATQKDVMRREAAAQKEKEARKKLVSRCASPRLSFCPFPSIQPHRHSVLVATCTASPDGMAGSARQFPTAEVAHPCVCVPVLLAEAHICKAVLHIVYGTLSTPSTRPPGVALGKTTLHAMQIRPGDEEHAFRAAPQGQGQGH